MIASASKTDPRQQLTYKALVVWAAAMLIYIVAIVGRTSFGVAAVGAMDRFHADASSIAMFTSLQIGTYAFAQIPVGMAIDRFGPRKLLVIGALVMAIGQTTLALTSSYGVALVARVFIGGGDATAFLSAMRILPFWFPMRLSPIFAQLTGGLGQLGQVISTVPFLALLHSAGWEVAFLSLGACGLLVAILGWIAVADAPLQLADATPSAPRVKPGAALKKVFRSPVCWYGFFIHWNAMVVQFTFTLLWGLPFLTLGLGLSPATAGLVLTINSATVILASPIHGVIASRLGVNRDIVMLTMTTLLTCTWIGVIAPSTARGMLAAVVLNVMIGVIAPTSNFAFDYVREGLDREIVATGTGLSNMGGFIATMLAAQSIGALLDWHSDGGQLGWADFHVALWVIPFIWAAGVAGGLCFRRGAHRQVHQQQGRLHTVASEQPH